jgi:hypothetical protein
LNYESDFGGEAFSTLLSVLTLASVFPAAGAAGVEEVLESVL